MSVPKLVEDLDYGVLKDICNLLNPSTRIGNDWRAFAGHLGLSVRDILLLEGDVNPAFAVLKQWLSRDGQKTVSFLIDVLRRIERFDAMRHLQDHEFTGVYL